jgi:hypothetical protein
VRREVIEIASLSRQQPIDFANEVGDFQVWAEK